MNRQLTEVKGQMFTSIFNKCQTRGLAHAESRNIAQAFSKKGVAPLWAELPREQGSGMPSLPFTRMAGETIASFIEALTGAKPLAPRGGGDVIPLPVYQCGLWLGELAFRSHRQLAGRWARPRGCLLSPRAWPPGGGAAQGTRPSLQPRVGRRCLHPRWEATRLSSPLREISHNGGKCQKQRPAIQNAAGRRGRGRRADASESPWTPAPEHLLLPGLVGQAGKLGQASGLVCCSAAAGQWQEVSGKGSSIHSLAHSCDRYLRSPY